MKHLSTHIALFVVTLCASPVFAAPPTENIATKNIAAINAAPRSLPSPTVEKLRALLANPKVAEGHIGLCIQALGRVPSAQTFPSKPYANNAKPILFQQNANSRFMPASNIKLYTAALALHKLGSEYSFVTRVNATAWQPEHGHCAGLALIGGGDPSLSTGDIEKIADGLVARGLKNVTGSVYGDASLLQAETSGGRYPDGWTLDDSIWYYGPEVSALSINRNQVDVYVTGSAKAGEPATLRIEPPLPPELDFEIHNLVTTGEANQETNITFDRGNADAPISRVLTISGKIAPGKTHTDGVAVPDAPKWAALALQKALEKRGVKFGPVPPSSRAYHPSERQTLVEHKSPPLKILLRKFLKDSDNLYGEMLLRAGGVSDEAAHGELRKWLRQNQVDDSPLRFEDGSGLSRYNIITPRATVGLLAAVETMQGGDAFWDALPIAGVDGTLKKRMIGTAAHINARAKTGTFSIVSTLSGYVTTRDGHRLAVSLLTNFVREGNDARQLQNDVFATLAEVSWQDAAMPRPN